MNTRHWISLSLACLLFSSMSRAYNSAPLKLKAGVQERAVQSVTNNILTVQIEDTTGQFTIITGTSHPQPSKTVFYPIGTTIITLRDVAANIVYHNGLSTSYTVGGPGLAGGTLTKMTHVSTTKIGTNAFQSKYTMPNWEVLQDVVINGTTLSDTNVRHTITVKNTSTAARTYGLRNMWDWMIAGNDASLFKTRQPDGTFTSSFTSYPAPTFKLYEEVDSSTAPTFSIFGSVRDLPLAPPPTLPDEVWYSSWQTSFGNAWDFNNTGGQVDSSVCYFWGKTNARSLNAGATAAFTQYVTTRMESIAPSLSVTKTAATSVQSGANLTYTFTVKNTGTGPANNIVLSDTLPAGTTYVSATGGTNPTVTNGVFSMTLPNLAAGATLAPSPTLTVKVNATSGTISNSVYSVGADGTGKAFGPTFSTSVAGPVLSISKTAATSVVSGSNLVYTFTVKNTGAAAATNVVLSDTIPTGTTYVSATGGTSPAVTNGVFTMTLPNIAAGATLSPSPTLTVKVTATSGSVSNSTYSVVATGATRAVGTGFTTQIQAGHPPVVTISPAGPVYARPCQPIQFTVTATDPDAGNTITLKTTTALPPGATLTPALPKTGSSPVTTQFLWTPTAAQLNNYTLTFQATDSTNLSSALVSFLIKKDAILPALTITIPALNAAQTTLPQIAGTASDAQTGIGAVTIVLRRVLDGKYWNGSAWVLDPVPLTTTLTGANWVRNTLLPATTNLLDGLYLVGAKVSDGAGNATQVVSSFVIDKVAPPRVQFDAPLQGNTVNSLLLATGFAQDNEGGTGISSVSLAIKRGSDGLYWTGKTATGWVTTLTYLRCTIWPVTGASLVTWTAPTPAYVMPSGTLLPNGTYTLTALARDRAGNGGSASVGVTVNSTVPTPYFSPAQTGDLSGITADGAAGTVTLNFGVTLAAGPVDADLFKVAVNGAPVAVDSLMATKTAVTLTLPADALAARDMVMVQFSGLKAADGRNLAGTAGPIIAR